MSAVAVVVVAVAAVVLLGLVLWFLWWQRPRNYHAEAEPPRVRDCDLCGLAPATVHLVETFTDAEEREFGGGSTAMRADYCQPCADQLGVGG